MKEERKIGYTLRSKYGGYLLYNFFGLRRDAIEYAKKQIANLPEYKWNDVWEIVKVEMRVLPNLLK